MHFSLMSGNLFSGVAAGSPIPEGSPSRCGREDDASVTSPREAGCRGAPHPCGRASDRGRTGRSPERRARAASARRHSDRRLPRENVGHSRVGVGHGNRTHVERFVMLLLNIARIPLDKQECPAFSVLNLHFKTEGTQNRPVGAGVKRPRLVGFPTRPAILGNGTPSDPRGSAGPDGIGHS
jgi:hypothetical protein